MASATSKAIRVAVVGNPNSGKTSLFNALTGLRAKVANYPGITVDLREATLVLRDEAGTRIPVKLIDFPGQYGLESSSPEEEIACQALTEEHPLRPDALLIVQAATNLGRSLYLTSQLLELNLPTIVAVNMIDEAEHAGLEIDMEQLQEELGCPIQAVSARSKQGLPDLKRHLGSLCQPLYAAQQSTIAAPVEAENPSPCQLKCAGCSCEQRHTWATELTQLSVKDPRTSGNPKIDRWLTSPIVGLGTLMSIMLLVFFAIFSLADIPMSLIEGTFGWLGDRIADFLSVADNSRVLQIGLATGINLGLAALVLWVGKFQRNRISYGIAGLLSIALALLPWSDFTSLIINGIIGGVAGVVVFLPQVCILFFFITLLEDSGYMARGAFVMERIMRWVGLPGKAFVPMLSAHACAIPGIMATRTIEDWRDRLVTILVLPLLTCSARLPVYAMIAALLFSDRPWLASLMFLGAYLLGVGAALGTAWVLKKSVMPGDAAPLVIELPPYRMPSLRNAWYTVLDRATIFLKKAGSVILVISIVLWILATYPKLPTAESTAIQEDNPQADSAVVERAIAQRSLEYSFAGRLGKAVEPVFRPLGFDWKIDVGVISSFAAREVVVSTLSIIYGIGEEGAEDEQGLVATLKGQTRPDGSAVFDLPTCLSLLVFYVLAMQCLPTQAVTRRETGSWKWAIFQLVYMTALAYVAALVVYQTTRMFV